MSSAGRTRRTPTASQTETAQTGNYRHPTAESPLRPEVGTQAQFRKKKPPVTYRYDSSLSRALDWNGQNGAREPGEWLLACIEEVSRMPAPQQFETPREFKDTSGKVVATIRGLADAVEQLKRLGKPFLNWAGKAERLSFDVPTLPLFIHERLSTKAIIETLTGHKKDKQLEFDLFGDPQHPITDQVLKAYEYKDKWVNRMILGDSLVVKAATVLAGSVVEGLLLWALEKEGDAKVRAAANGKRVKIEKTPLNEWHLGGMIGAAYACNIINEQTKKQVEVVQDFRNLIHPGRAVRLKDACSLGTAHAALAAAERVAEDLARKYS